MTASFQYEFFIIIAPITALAVIGVISFAQFRFPSKETRSLTLLMLGTAGWLLFNTLEVYVPTEAATLFFAKVTYVFILLTPVAWFTFALRFSGQGKWLAPKYLGLLLSIPLIGLLLVWSNDWHHLIWRGLRFIPIGNMLALSPTRYGSVFWLLVGYNYLLTLSGSILLLTHYFRADLYRTQSYWLVLGALIPIAANFIYLFRLIPGLTKDYTPISFGLAIMSIAAGMVRHRLFDILPIAREAMIDSMIDAMFAIDAQTRISDCNAAGERLLGTSRSNLLGKPVDQIFSTWTTLLDYMREPHMDRREIAHVGKHGIVHFDIQFLPLFNRNKERAGQLLVLRDITNLRQAEVTLQRSNQELRASNRFLDAYAQTIARDLKNPLLTIRASTNLLKTRQNEVSSGTVDYLISNINEHSQKMLTLLEELLLISTVRQTEEISFTTLKMGSLIDSALKRLPTSETFKKEKIILPDEWPVAFGKPAWVEEIWVNYFTVFAQSSVSGVTLQIGASKNGTEATARFWVQNVGAPLPAEDRAQLLRTFSELESIRMDEFGLGLSMVKRIVTRLNGQMGIENDRTTCMWFTLPAQIDPAPVEEIQANQITA